jgi:MerR family redox-sensitive transcriptional activator SoxR
VLFLSFSNAGPSSSKWRFLTSGDNASALQAKGDTCSVCAEGSGVAEIAAGATTAIAVMNLNIFLMVFRRYEFKSTLSQRKCFKKNARDFRGVQRGALLGFGVAGDLAISDVARVFGLRTSAIRYYEQIGILPPPLRRNGQRRYDNSALFRLAVVQRARETGFTLEEIRELFFGFPPGTRPPKRWHQLSRRKIAELRAQMKRLKQMETLLKRVEDCRCDALDECGEKILVSRL